MNKIRIIRKVDFDTRKRVNKPSVRVYQWPNETYSLHVKRPTKNLSQACTVGWLIGSYWTFESAKKAALKWLNKHK